MAYVPGFSHDVFVSYAHVDNVPEPGEDEGWVTVLVQSLKTKLAQKLGRDNLVSLWIDDDLDGHSGVTQQIADSIAKTATLLVILSPGYVASEWCERERGLFLEHVAGRRTTSSSQLFLVHRDKVDPRDAVPEFEDLKGFRFWSQDSQSKPTFIFGTPKPVPDDRRYYDRLNDLASQLADELRALKSHASAGNGNGHLVDVGQRPCVFLAEPTDDLDEAYEDTKRYLQQAQVRVLPDSWYPREPSGFQEAVDRDLAQCRLFVQLLGGTAGKRTPDIPNGYAALQLARAQTFKKPVVQWRSLDLDVRKVADANYRALLLGETVLAMSLEEFKRTVKERALAKDAPLGGRSVEAFVFVNRETEDCSLADQVCSALKRYGAGYLLPDRRGTPEEIRRDLEQKILDCNALIVVYGASDRGWVDNQLLQCRKVISKREQPLQAVAVYEGPPEPKQPLNVNLPKMLTIDCRKGLDDGALTSFLQGLV